MKYEELEIEVVLYDEEDIITSSSPCPYEGDIIGQ